jgi:hypothetical protein
MDWRIALKDLMAGKSSMKEDEYLLQAAEFLDVHHKTMLATLDERPDPPTLDSVLNRLGVNRHA